MFKLRCYKFEQAINVSKFEKIETKFSKCKNQAFTYNKFLRQMQIKLDSVNEQSACGWHGFEAHELNEATKTKQSD